MAEDKEIAAINEKKLKAKGAKVIEERQTLTANQVILNVAEYLNTRGLEAMNLSNELKTLVANNGQAKLVQRNQNDSEKK